jgi:hypothetical protein
VTWSEDGNVRSEFFTPGTQSVVDRVLRTIEEYVAWNTEGLARIIAGQPLSSDRVLVFKSRSTGMGNNWEGFLSTFLYAVLTSRIFAYHSFKGLEQMSLDLPGADKATLVEESMRAMHWERHLSPKGGPLPSQCDDDTQKETKWLESQVGHNIVLIAVTVALGFFF